MDKKFYRIILLYLLPLSQGFSFNDILERAFKVNCKGLKVLLLLLLSPVPKFFNEVGAVVTGLPRN